MYPWLTQSILRATVGVNLTTYQKAPLEVALAYQNHGASGI